MFIVSAQTELKVKRVLNSKENENEAIEEVVKGSLIRLHLYFDTLKELCIRYENAPYLQKLPTKKKIISVEYKDKVYPVAKENFVFSIALEAESHAIDLRDNKGTVEESLYPITQFYIKSTIEKFDLEYPFSVLCFNCTPTQLFPKEPERLSLKVTLASVDGSTHYEGHIPVSFKVYNATLVILIF